ncbi:MAG: Ribonuclease 3 [Candidatus Heimdallarchaeota archaeon LC_3]|nr:MAG: Ribonuclease 3 [Candidatus Heimdallarchaeota archaeon LC_3]
MDNEKGSLTDINKRRQELESNKYQAGLFDNLKLEEIILTTQPEKSRSEHNKGTAVEVILGAMYLDNGLESVKRFIKGWE